MPQLDKGFEIFANWQSISYALGIYVLTYVCRTIIEYFWKNWKANKLYNELILHLFPIFAGGLITLAAKKFPYPMPIGESASARIFYGAILGMLCGVLYGRVRAWIAGQTSVTVPLPTGNSVTLPPEAPPPEPEVKP